MSQNFPSNNKRAPNGGNFAQFNTRKTHKTNTFSNNFPNNFPSKPSIPSNRSNSNTNYLPSPNSKPVNDFKSNDFYNVNTFKHPKPNIKSLDINERRKHRMANYHSNGRKKNRTQRDEKKEQDDDDDDKKDDLHRNRYFDDRRKMSFTEQERRDTLMGLENCKDNKKLALMREYEILYEIPLLLYMYDIMGLLRVRKGIKSENIDLLFQLLPCNGGIFHNLWRKHQQKQVHWLSQNKLSIPKEIKSMLTLSRQEYASHLPQIPLPNQIKFKVDGIWETDVKIIRAFNKYLDSKLDRDREDNDNVYNGEHCAYHLRIWCNGLVKEIMEEYKNNEESIYDADGDDDDDDESEDDYDEEYQLPEVKTVEDDEFYTDIIKNCGNIKIEDIIQQNKHLKIKTVRRQPLKEQGTAIKMISRDKYDTPDIDYNYESMKDFVERICEGPAKGKTGQAVMILIDTRNDPEITCYIWKKSMIFPDNIKNIKLGKNRIDYRKQKYFDLTYNGRTVNVGQYIGLSTIILEGRIHQFWNIFNTEIRFDPGHALNLWPDFYKNQTLFEVVTDFENQYKNKDQEKQEKYRKYFGGDFVDKLNKKNSKFKYDLIRKIIDKNKDLHPEKKDNYPRNHDEDDEQKPAPPDIEEFEPFIYHHKNTRIVWDLQEDLKGKDRQRIIIDLSPKQFKQVMAHSMAFKFEDVANDDDKHGDKPLPDEIN